MSLDLSYQHSYNKTVKIIACTIICIYCTLVMWNEPSPGMGVGRNVGRFYVTGLQSATDMLVGVKRMPVSPRKLAKMERKCTVRPRR